MTTWSFKIDGTEINDNVMFHVAGIPQIDDVPEYDVILVSLADRHPVFVRTQPTEGVYTMNIAMIPPCPPDEYQTRKDFLKSVMTPGLHTLTYQGRGMAAPASMDVIVRSMIFAYKLRLCSVGLVAPEPILV